MHVAIVGAGFTGAVIAHQLAQAGHTATVFESRAHVAGNCHIERDSATGVMMHVYPYQGIPRDGYTALVERMLDSPGVTLHLETRFDPARKGQFDHVFYSGPIDAWFGYPFGRLGYRTLDFEVLRDQGDYQGNAVINYCDFAVPFTRISEHKHFAPWEQHEATVCYREFSRECTEDDISYYPIRLAQERAQLAQYVDLAEREEGVTFAGRLGTYRYLDMDVTIKEALETADRFLSCLRNGEPMPAFVVPHPR
jgi:UDP-galactopyranose mutase